MKYDQTTAEKIAELHNIPIATLKTWQHRNNIPNKYFNPDNSIKEHISEKISDNEIYRIRKIYEGTNSINWAEIKSISRTKIQDLVRGKGTLNKDEYNALKKELIDFKNKGQKIFLPKTHDARVRELKDFIKHPLIKPYTLLESKYPIDNLLADRDIEVTECEQIIINIGLLFQSFIL